MAGNQGPGMDRRQQDAYETRSTRIQHHLWHLQEEYERLAAQRPCAPDFTQYDQQHLNQLDAQLRASIDHIRNCITDNNRAVSDWDALITRYRLREDNGTWARTQLRHHAAHFDDPTIAPSLYFKFCELMHIYQDARYQLEPYLQQSSASQADRRTLGPLPESQSPSTRTTTVQLPPAAAVSSPSASALPQPPRPDVSNRHHFYAQASPSSQFWTSTGSRSAPEGQTQSSTRPSFRGGRTFTNTAYRRSGSARTVGVMATTDGNVATAIPMPWQQLPATETLRLQTPTPSVQSGPLPTGTSGSGSQAGSENMGSTVAQAASSPMAPSRSVRKQPTEEHRRRLQQVLQNASGPAPTTFAAGNTTAHSVAAGRGSFIPTSGPLSVGADGRPLNASSSTGPHGSSASSVDFGEDFSMENSSAFYRNATFHRAIHSSTAPSPLVLKDLPITHFEGDVRQYPKFRNRFLDVVEAHPNLAPRQKLQYLLQFLRGEPHQLANNFQITDTNYFAVINLLEERYGNADMIRNLLMQDLIQIRPPAQSVADLRRFHDQAFRVTTELKQLGDNVDANRLYEQTLMAKLPSALKIELIRHSDYAEKKTVTSILQGLRKHTQVLELTASSGITWSTTSGHSAPSDTNGLRRSHSPNRQQHRSGSRERNNGYGRSSPRPRPGGYAADADTILVADIQHASEVCTLCDLQHSPAECTFYTSVYMKRRRVKQLGLCSLCLGEGHRTAPCPRSAMGNCSRCHDGQHHETLCSTAEVSSPASSHRRRTVTPPTPAARSDEALATSDSTVGGARDRLQDPDQQRYSQPGIPVKAGATFDEAAAHGNVPRSAQRVTRGLSFDEANSKRIPGQTRTEEERTTPKGRPGTTPPTIAEALESLYQQQSNAFGSSGLLNHCSLRTARDSPRTNVAQEPGAFDDQERVRLTPYSPSGVLRNTEEVTVHPTRPSCTAPDHCSVGEEHSRDEVNRFDTTPAVLHRSESSRGGNDDSEGLASTTITTTEEEQPRTSPPSDAPTVILECIKTTVMNLHDGQSREALLLFDSGSSTSCISPQLVQELNLQRRDARKLRVNAFGSSAPMSYEGATVSIGLTTQEKPPLRISISTMPRRLPTLQMAPISEAQLAALRRDAIPAPVTREAPDILIGQDLFHLFERTTLPRLPQGFAVISTIFGPTISGAGRPTPTNTTARTGGFSPLLNLRDSAKDPRSASPLLDLRDASTSSEGLSPLLDLQELPTTCRCASPLLDVSDAPKRQTTPNMTAGTHAEEKPSTFWSAARSPTKRDDWTRRWTLLHFYHLNPLDADLEQENAISSPNVDKALRSEHLFKTDEPPPQTDDSSQEQPPSARALQEILPNPVPNPCPAVATSSFDDFFNFLSIFCDAIDDSCSRVSQRTLPSSISPTLKRRGSRRENLRTVPASSTCEKDAIADPFVIDQTPLSDANCVKSRFGPLPNDSLIFLANSSEFSDANLVELLPCTVASHFASNFSIPGKHHEMASGKKEDTPTGDLQLWCNIDDDESDQNPYIQKTRSRSSSNKRKPWSGTPQFGPLPTAGSTATEAASSSQQTASQPPVDSRFGPLPIADETGSEATTMPKDPATETTDKSDSGPLPNQDNDADAASSASISASSSTEQLNKPKGLLAKTKAAKRVARKLFRKQHMVKPPTLTAADVAAVRKIQAELKQVKTEPVSRPTSPEQNIVQPPELSDLEKATAEKIRAQLKKEREAAAAKPKQVQRPTSPYLFMELSAAQHVRTVAELKTAVKQLYQRWQHTQPPGPSPIVFSPMWKEKHPYGSKLWREFVQLEQIVAAREAEDAGKAATTASTSSNGEQLPPAADPPRTTEEERKRCQEELERKFLASDDFDPETMTEEDVHQACIELMAEKEAEHPDESEMMPLEPTAEQQPPLDEAMMEDIGKILATGSSTKPISPAPFRNPSPPPEMDTDAIEVDPPPPQLPSQGMRMSLYPQDLGLTPCRPRSPPDNHKTAVKRVTDWLHSTATPTGKQPPAKTAAAKSSSREGHESRPQYGNKRSSTTASSTAPPAQRRRDRDVSKSPVRDKSPGVYRKNMLRVQCSQPPLPIIDGFVCKDLAVHLKRSGTPFKDAHWTASLNQPNDKFLFVGAINAIGVPSLYLPADTLPDGEPKYYKRIAASNRHPLADLTRKEFDEEQSILPSIFIIGHTYGAFPQYATMVTSETRILLCSKIRPTTKLYSSLRNVGIGPTGYDLKGTDATYINDIKDQRTALVRLGRSARNADRCLRVMISYSDIPDNFDPHQDAIDELKKNAELHENHPIHLVSYTGTALDMLKWLRGFPNVVFGISLYQLLYHTGVLENTEPTTQAYNDSAMFRTLLQRIPLRHIAIQSACPFPIVEIPGSHFSPHQLLGIGDAFERLTQTQLSGAALYAHSAQNLQRLYNLSKELLKNLAHAVDQRPDRLTIDQFFVAMDALYAPVAVARADPMDQNERRRSSVAEASPMSGVEDGGADAPAQPHKQRSQSARRRRSPSPTRSKDGRSRASDKHQYQKKSSQPGPLPTVELKQSISKSSDKDNERTGSQFGPLSTVDAAKHRDKARSSSSRNSPPKSPEVRRRIEYTSPPARQPTVQSQVFVPEKSRSASTGELRIFVQQTPVFKEPYPPSRAAAKQDRPPTDRRPRTSSARPTSSRAPVQERIEFKVPKPFTAKDTLKEFRKRRSGGSSGPLPSSSVEVFSGSDPLLKPEPVLTSIVPAPTELREYFDYVKPYFHHQRNEETGRMSARVIADSLATDEVPRALPADIHITHGCDLPWNPIRVCRGHGEGAHFHQTLLQATLIGQKHRWQRSGPIKTDRAYRELLDNVLDLTVHCFGQMILIKYGFRLRNDDERAGECLKFIEEVLTADLDNLEDELPRILARFQPRMARPGLNNPWPNEDDFYRAAEHWVCYCEEAFVYTFKRLTGPASWNTDWLQHQILPQVARQTVIDTMVNQAQAHFDKLRHQVYIQYGRHHIDAEDRVQFRWRRFDDHPKHRTDIQLRDYLYEPTICFVDQNTKTTFGQNLRNTVRMITIPEGTSAEIYAFVRRFYPSGTVRRFVFWFGRHLLMDRQHDYYDLMADLHHHTATYFCPLQIYVVLPAYVRDRFNHWTAGPLAVFVHRDVIVPDARVVLHHLDLALWFCDAKGADQPLPISIDSTGRLSNVPADISIRKNRMTHDHGLDLWLDTISKVEAKTQRTAKPTTSREPAPLMYSPDASPPPTTRRTKERVSCPLQDTPTASTSTAPPPSSTEDVALLKGLLGLDKVAEYLTAKMQEKVTAPLDARLSAIERALGRAEREEDEPDDSDALSEPTPYKERGSDE